MNEFSYESILGHSLPFCFVGGPYTNPDPTTNIRKAALLVNRLWEDGIVFPICPMIEASLQNLICPQPYDWWVVRTARYIPLCNVGIFLPGESSGKLKEQSIFEMMGHPFFENPDVGESIKQLYEWVENWRRP